MKQLIGVLRTGAGQQPAVMVMGYVSSADDWAGRTSLATITRCVTLPVGGNPVEIKKRFLDVFPEGAQRLINEGQNRDDETRPRARKGRHATRRHPGRRPPKPPLLVLDDTCDPSAEDMMRWNRVLQVTTGRTANPPAMARLELLADLRSRMGLRGLRVSADEKEESDMLRKALQEVSNKAPRIEEDGLALVETSEVESVALAAAIFAHTAFNYTGGWGSRPPYKLGPGL